ncbi:MAG: polyketide-8 synthase acyl carrier protein [Acidobacteria bacterium]|nr:MAG: polyketide-8 synthase acyl carrier protein [Acidobacteriota bacterium]
MTLDEAQVAKIRTLIAEIIEVEEDQIGSQTRFEDLGADSLRAIEIMAELEKTFGVSIHQDRLAEMTTLQGVCAVMQASLSEGVKTCDVTAS